MHSVTFSREELYGLVWKSTMGKITDKYGISSHALRSGCAALQVPLPYASYWVLLKYGRAWVTKLPEPYQGEASIVIVKKKYETNVPVPIASPIVLLTKEIEKDPKAPLKVPDTLRVPVKLISQTKVYWEKQKRNKNYCEENPEVLYFNVTHEHYPRAMRFMNAFIKLLEYRGHKVQNNRYNCTVAVIGGIEIELYLREASKRIATTGSSYGATELIRTGAFIFQVGKYSDQKEWRDGKIPIEGLLARITAKLELLAIKETESNERYRLNQIEREKKEAIEKASAQKRKTEKEDFMNLLLKAERYDQATKLRNYLQAVKRNTGRENTQDSEQQKMA